MACIVLTGSAFDFYTLIKKTNALEWAGFSSLVLYTRFTHRLYILEEE